MKLLTPRTLLISFLAAAVSCGGGGGGPGPGSPPPPPPSPPPPSPPPPPTGDYTMHTLSPLAGDDNAQAQGINNLGQVVGFSLGPASGQTAVLWTVDENGMVSVEDLGKLAGGTFSFAAGINNRGQVVGFGDGSAGTRRAFIWTAANGIQDLGVPTGLVGGQAISINDAGQIAGAMFEIEFTQLSGDGRLGVWTVDDNGAVTSEANHGPLGGRAATAFANNANGVIVGDIWFAGGSQTGFSWSSTIGVVELNVEEALAINDLGDIAGVFSDDGIDGFVLEQSGELHTIVTGIVMDINNQQQAVGRFGFNGPQQAFIWEDGQTMLMPHGNDRDFSGATSINEVGWIVGWSADVDDNQYASLWIPN